MCSYKWIYAVVKIKFVQLSCWFRVNRDLHDFQLQSVRWKAMKASCAVLKCPSCNHNITAMTVGQLEIESGNRYQASSWRATRAATKRWRAWGRREERKAEQARNCRKQRRAAERWWMSDRDTAPHSTSNISRFSVPGDSEFPTRYSLCNHWHQPSTSQTLLQL